MAKITLAQENVTTPSAGFGKGAFDNSNGQWYQRLPSGLYQIDWFKAITAQIAAHSADTYYVGLQLPNFSMQAGMVFWWTFWATKGAAGVAAPTFIVRIGAAGTVADTARITLTGAAQTAAADGAQIDVIVTVRSVGVAGQLHGIMRMQHDLAATGFENAGPAGFQLVENLPATFDNTALGGQFIGLSVNPGAAGAWVVNQAIARGWAG
jgi:hypothetical protein